LFPFVYIIVAVALAAGAVARECSPPGWLIVDLSTITTRGNEFLTDG